MRHPRFGSPAEVIDAAFEALGRPGDVVATSPVIASEPVGPSTRRYANACAIVESAYEPPAMLAELQEIERDFGRKRLGRPWRERTLDLDIVLWSGGMYTSHGLAIPHPCFRERAFVTGPASAIAPGWRDPLTGLTLRQLHARLTRPRPLPSARGWSGR